jgi:hypothetical protein
VLDVARLNNEWAFFYQIVSAPSIDSIKSNFESIATPVPAGVDFDTLPFLGT